MTKSTVGEVWNSKNCVRWN